MKVTVTKFIGPNTIIGKSGGKLVRARVPVNNRPKIGQEVELDDEECQDYVEPKAEKVAPSVGVQVPGSEPPKK